MSVKHVLVSCLVLGGAMACSESSGDSGDTGGTGGAPGRDAAVVDGAVADATFADAAIECPLRGSTCPAGCGVIFGRPLNVTLGCTDGSSRLGCWPSGRLTTTDIGCIRSTASSEVYVLSSGSYASVLASTSEFEDCTEDERTGLVDARQCPSGDGGACPNDRERCPDGCNAFTGQRLDQTDHCLQEATQLGCFSESGNVTRNGGCVKQKDTGQVWLVESGSYANQLLLDPAYQTCSLADSAGPGGPFVDCP
jgi:hypothetical protein